MVPQPMRDIKIAIIGGGPSGLISLYECKMRNIKATLFEKEDKIGGIWNLIPNKGFAHTSTVLNTAAIMNSYNLDFTLPNFLKEKYSKDVDYATSTDFNQYLKTFVEYYDLTSMISLSTKILDITSGDSEQRFTLMTINLLSKEERMYYYDYVIFTTGRFGEAIVPDDPFLSYPLKMNQGCIYHTNQWDPLNLKSPSSKIMETKTPKVLITGGSISAGDAINDTINSAKNLRNYKNLKIYWAPSRNPENRNLRLISRYPYKTKKSMLPIHESINRFSLWFRKWQFTKQMVEFSEPLILHTENEVLNLSRDLYSFDDEGLIKKAIQDGTLVLLKDPIARIYQTSSSQTAFDTKSFKEILVDAVVIGSGYNQTELKINGKNIYQDSYRYREILPIDTSCHGRIGYICMIATFGSMISMAQMEAKWLLFQWFDKNSNLEKNLEIMRSKYSKTKNEKVLIKTPGPALDTLAGDMNVCPTIWRNLFSLRCRRRHIALACIFGPWSIYQYATVGETDSERQKREDLLLISTRNTYQKCGQSFRFICVMSDMAYYMSLAAILTVSYMNYDFMKEKIMSTFNVYLRDYF